MSPSLTPRRPFTFTQRRGTTDWLPLGPIVMVAWLFAIPLVLSYGAVLFVIEALFVIRLWRSDDSESNDLGGGGFDEGHVNASDLH